MPEYTCPDVRTRIWNLHGHAMWIRCRGMRVANRQTVMGKPRLDLNRHMETTRTWPLFVRFAQSSLILIERVGYPLIPQGALFDEYQDASGHAGLGRIPFSQRATIRHRDAASGLVLDIRRTLKSRLKWEPRSETALSNNSGPFVRNPGGHGHGLAWSALGDQKIFLALAGIDFTLQPFGHLAATGPGVASFGVAVFRGNGGALAARTAARGAQIA